MEPAFRGILRSSWLQLYLRARRLHKSSGTLHTVVVPPSPPRILAWLRFDEQSRRVGLVFGRVFNYIYYMFKRPHKLSHIIPPQDRSVGLDLLGCWGFGSAGRLASRHFGSFRAARWTVLVRCQDDDLARGLLQKIWVEISGRISSGTYPW